MTVLSERLAAVRPSQTKAMAARAAKLSAQGKDIVNLSLGEPDFHTPAHVREAAIDAIQSGHTRYTAVSGTRLLRETIAGKFETDNGLKFDPEQITVGSGAKQVLFNALLASLNPGDEVVYATPCWTSYPEMIRLAGGVPVPVDCTETGFVMSAEALQRAVTPRSKWLLLNSPSNPTGAVYSRDALADLASVLRRHPRLWVMSDDIYEHLVYDDAEFATIAEVAPDLQSRSLTVNGVSKAYAMTGWRIGYGAGPSELIKGMNIVQSQSTSHACSISQHAAVEALRRGSAAVADFVGQFGERRDIVLQKLAAVPGFECKTRPQGAFYLFPSCAGLIGLESPDGGTIASDTDLAEYLLESAQVAIMPGSAFCASSHIRISYAASAEVLEKAMSRIEEACAKLRAPRNTKASAS